MDGIARTAFQPTGLVRASNYRAHDLAARTTCCPGARSAQEATDDVTTYELPLVVTLRVPTPTTSCRDYLPGLHHPLICLAVRLQDVRPPLFHKRRQRGSSGETASPWWLKKIGDLGCGRARVPSLLFFPCHGLRQLRPARKLPSKCGPKWSLGPRKIVNFQASRSGCSFAGPESRALR